MRYMLTLFVFAFVTIAHAADWPQFRGPGGNAVSDEKELPVQFTEKEGVRWKAELPGRGVSSPVVVGGKAFVTCSTGTRDDRLHVVAFDTKTGKKLWHRQLNATGNTTAHPKTCMAANTPVADAKAVYCLFATGDTIALDHDGGVLWYRSLVGDYPTISNQVGMASSPVLFKDSLIVPMDNIGESFIAAIDTATGKNRWKTSRPKDISWATPTIRPLTSDEAEVLLPGPKDLTAFDLATGKKKWTAAASSYSPSLTLTDGLIVAPTGGITVYKPNADKLEEVWKSPKYRTGYSSPLYYDGRVYAANPGGVLFCVDAKNGKAIWEERLQGKQTFSASPVAGDGKVYVLSESGRLLTIKSTGDAFEILGTSEFKEECLATPAISGGALFIRTDKHLWCLGK